MINIDDDANCGGDPCPKADDLLHLLSFSIWKSIITDVPFDEVLEANALDIESAKP